MMEFTRHIFMAEMGREFMIWTILMKEKFRPVINLSLGRIRKVRRT